MNRDSILSVYSDARAEYTKQLCVFLVPAYFQFFINLLEKAKQAMIAAPKRSLWQFQNYLNEIHDWNMEKVNNEINTINTNCGCDYLDDLLTAVFIAHTKVLTAIRLSSNKKKIEINVPKVEHFLFKVLCETSKLLWSSTYLFREDISGIEKQQNYRNIEGILNEGILQAIRSLVPVKSILKDFVNNDGDDTNNDATDIADTDTTDTTDVGDITNATNVTNNVINTADMVDSTTDDINNTIDNIANKENDNDEKVDNNIKTSPQEITIPQSVSIPDTESILQVKPLVAAPLSMSSSLDIHNESTPKNEIIQLPPQTIIIEDKPTVRFGEFDAVFDSDHPMDSDMIYDPKENDEDDVVPALEILDEIGTPLSNDFDFDSLDEKRD